MIIPRDTITEIQRQGWGEVTVQADPPAQGSTFWVRSSAMAERPVCEVRVADVWELRDGGHVVALEPVKEAFKVPRKKAEKRPFRLTRAQRARVFDGDDSPLLFEEEPKCTKGDKLFLSWSRPKRVYDKATRRVSTPPREPLVWIEIRSKGRRPAHEGGWEVRFKIVDHRPLKTRLVRRTPPTLGHETMRQDLRRAEATKKDLLHSITDEEKAEAREGSSYTTDPRNAVDTLEAVDDDTLDQFVAEALEGDADRERKRRERWENMTLKERAAEIERLRPQSRADVTSELRTAAKAMSKALEKLDRDSRAA